MSRSVVLLARHAESFGWLVMVQGVPREAASLGPAGMWAVSPRTGKVRPSPLFHGRNVI